MGIIYENNIFGARAYYYNSVNKKKILFEFLFKNFNQKIKKTLFENYEILNIFNIKYNFYKFEFYTKLEYNDENIWLEVTPEQFVNRCKIY